MITLDLSESEALVMLEWLDRLEEPENLDGLPPFESAALRLRWDLEAMLESVHPYVFASDYESRLETAIDEVRDETTPEDCVEDATQRRPTAGPPTPVN